MSIKDKKDETKSITATTLDVSPEEMGFSQEVVTDEVKRIAPLIYLGPNLPGGRLLQSTVFRGGIPVYMEQLLNEQPDVATLIVPVDEMSGAQERINQTGTPENVSYQAILRGGPVNGV